MEGLRPGWTMKVIIVIVFTSILFRCVSATTHLVGGQSGWDLRSNLQAWSASTTFYVGDVLVFSYGPMHDVLEVNQFDFARCRTINPISTYRDGETVVTLAQAGTRYFICGRRGHCAMGLRLRLQVHSHSPPPPPPANASTSDGSSSSASSNGTQPGGADNEQGRRGGGGSSGNKGTPPHGSPPPNSTLLLPPPPSHPHHPPGYGNEEPSPPDITLPHPAETPAPPFSGVMAGLAYNWWLPFTTLVLIC